MVVAASPAVVTTLLAALLLLAAQSRWLDATHSLVQNEAKAAKEAKGKGKARRG